MTIETPTFAVVADMLPKHVLNFVLLPRLLPRPFFVNKIGGLVFVDSDNCSVVKANRAVVFRLHSRTFHELAGGRQRYVKKVCDKHRDRCDRALQVMRVAGTEQLWRKSAHMIVQLLQIIRWVCLVFIFIIRVIFHPL